ncbi:MAG: cysteine desulfurase family protein [Candidatus Hermodarchaeota archaeon]
MVKQINFNHSAGVPVDERVLMKMKPYFRQYYGNPSSVHSVGQQSAKAIANARVQVGQLIGAMPKDHIIFTSGATEANNLALQGFAYRNRRKGNHIIISKMEHLSIINTAKFLSKQGFEYTQVGVNKHGIVDTKALKEAITDQTILISIQHANNEVGTIQPIADIAKVANKVEIPLHVDAVASAGLIPVNASELGISLLTLSSNDLYGPKGVGALYAQKGVALQPILTGGGQENGIRSGSENVPGIVGMGAAAELAKEQLAENVTRLTWLRDRLIKGVLENIDESFLNGHPTQRLPNNANIRFSYIEGEAITLHLSFQGFLVATSSACTSKTLAPSHCLLSMGVSEAEAHGALQLTLGRENTQAHIDKFVEVLPPIIEKLRAMSPLSKDVPYSLFEDEEHDHHH